MNNKFLQDLKKKRSANFDKEIADHIYKDCLRQIENANDVNVTQYLFEVPSILIGKPLYNVVVITQLIIKQLKKLQFKVMFIEPNKIHIDWTI